MSMIIDGTNGLTFNNATTQASAGSVIQVVSGTYATQASNSTQTYADTGLTATITPKFATSKILVLVNHHECAKTAANSLSALGLNLCRNGSQITEFCYDVGFTNSATSLYFTMAGSYYDSPSSTSALTYKTQFKNSEVAAQILVQTNNKPSIITLLEIAQ